MWAPAAAARRRRDEELRQWRRTFSDTSPIAELAPRQVGSCVGVVERIRLDAHRFIAVTITDGTGHATGVWTGRSRLPGLRLGAALRLTGTVAGSDADRTLRNPDWDLVMGPEG